LDGVEKEENWNSGLQFEEILRDKDSKASTILFLDKPGNLLDKTSRQI
jgi:hypothetical protein